MTRHISQTLRLYKYKMNDISMVNGENGDTMTISRRYITAFSIEKNYSELFLPVFMVKVSVNEEMYRFINSSREIKYNISVDKYSIKTSSADFINNTIDDYACERAFSGVFKNYNDGDPMIDMNEKNKTIRKEAEGKSDKELPPIEEMQYNIELFLFVDRVIDNMRVLNDTLFTECTVSEILHFLIQSRGIKKCLMTVPDNNTKYNEPILVPSNLKLRPCIEYIQNKYGIYKTGMVLFNDIDRFYLLSGANKPTAWERDETVDVYMVFSGTESQEGNTYGAYLDDANDRWYINNSNQPQVSKTNSIIKTETADEYVFMDTYANNIDRKQIDKNTRSVTHKNLAVLDNKYSNIYAVESFMHNIRTRDIQIVVDIDEFDVMEISPNKRYYLDFRMGNNDTSMSYSGYYKLFSANSIFITDADHFVLKTRCVFKKEFPDETVI